MFGVFAIQTFLISLHLVSLLIFGSQVDLPSSRRCDLRQSKLHSVQWKPCRDELVGASVWRCHVPGLHAGPRRALGRGWWFERSVFAEKQISFRVNSWGSKRRFEGIWTDVSCIFDYKLAFISILENWFSILEHGD